MSWTRDGYLAASTDSALARIRSLGASHVTLLVTYYQNSPASPVMQADPVLTPSMSSLRSAAARAEHYGLRVGLKPHIDVRDGSWRGTIDPTDPALWFASYGDLVKQLAVLADSLRMSYLIIGTELGGTLRESARWVSLIRDIRAQFTGTLTYAASWDEVFLVPFWNELDCVGIDFYAPVSVRPNPGRVEILAGWQPWANRLVLIHRLTQKPLLFTEIGYRSIDGAGMTPYAHEEAGLLDCREQADLYWAALETAASLDGCAGLLWWNWRVDGTEGPTDDGYTPSRKPAEMELASAWSH